MVFFFLLHNVITAQNTSTKGGCFPLGDINNLCVSFTISHVKEMGQELHHKIMKKKYG